MYECCCLCGTEGDLCVVLLCYRSTVSTQALACFCITCSTVVLHALRPTSPDSDELAEPPLSPFSGLPLRALRPPSRLFGCPILPRLGCPTGLPCFSFLVSRFSFLVSCFLFPWTSSFGLDFPRRACEIAASIEKKKIPHISTLILILGPPLFFCRFFSAFVGLKGLWCR